MIDRITLNQTNTNIVILTNYWNVSIDSYGSHRYLLYLDNSFKNIKRVKNAPIKLDYREGSKRLSITFNLAKIMFGSNIVDNQRVELNDFLSKFNSGLSKYIQNIDLQHMKIAFFEYGVNIPVERPPREYTQLMLDNCPVQFNRHKRVSVVHSFSYSNKSNSGIFYDKIDEFEKKHKVIYIPTKNNNAKYLLRYELKMKENSIKNIHFFGQDLLFEDLFKRPFISRMHEIMLFWFDRNIGDFFSKRQSSKFVDYDKISNLTKKNHKQSALKNLSLITASYALRNVTVAKLIDELDTVLKLNGNKLSRSTKSKYIKILSQIPRPFVGNLLKELRTKIVEKLDSKEHLFEHGGIL